MERPPLCVSQFGPTYDVDTIERKLAEADALAAYPVDACERLRCEYEHLSSCDAPDENIGRRGDIVRQLMAHGLTLAQIASYVERPEAEIVRVIAPRALYGRVDDVLLADEQLRSADGFSWQQVAKMRHLPLGFVEQLAQWQNSDADVRARKLCASLILLHGYGTQDAIDVAAKEYGVTLPYMTVAAWKRPERQASVKARFGLL